MELEAELNPLGGVTMRAVLALLLGTLLGAQTACGDHEGGLPHSAHATKKPKTQPALPDAETADASTTEDAAQTDAGTEDAAVSIESRDAGAQLDASAPKLEDAAVGPPAPLDASVQDADVTDAASTRTATAAETVAPRMVQAGQELLVLCLLRDADQQRYLPPTSLKSELQADPPESVHVQSDGTIVATRSGELKVACIFPAVGLTDSSPAVIQVTPGTPTRTTAAVTQSAILAGDTTTASCQVEDAWGNEVGSLTPRLRALPSDPANTFLGNVGTFKRSGDFELHCELDGAVSVPAKVGVSPGLPATLSISLVPEKSTYAIGETVQVNRSVVDRFGNPLASVAVPVTSDPDGIGKGAGRFSYSKSGRYRLTATVPPPTENGTALSKTVEIVVDGTGPLLTCDSPVDGEFVHLTPGGTVQFRGSASDPSGISELRINGRPTNVDSAGHFVSAFAGQFGVNFVDLAASDEHGHETKRTCAFILADRWAPALGLYSDTLSLRLRQAAVDDTSRTDDDSLGDILYRVLGSDGLRNSINDSMLEHRILKGGCDQSILGTCVVSSQVTYLDCEVHGPNHVNLTLTEGGFAASTRVENLAIELQLDGQVAGLSYTNRGFVDFESIDVNTIFDVVVEGGRPRVKVRSGNTTTSAGRITTEFPGIEGEALNVLVALTNDIIREYVAMRVQAFVTDDLNQVLDGVVASLAVDSLGSGFTVARLDGSGVIPLEFLSQFSSVSTTTSRMLFGLGTRFTAPSAQARPSLGIPMSSENSLLDVSGAPPVGVAMHELLFGQGLHALWRAGYFDTALDSSNQALGMPAGMQVKISAQLPPLAQVLDARVEVAMGAVMATLTYPDLLPGPVPMAIGAKVSMTPRLAGDAIVFEDFRLDELHLSIDAPDLNPFTRAAIESSVPSVLEYVLSNAMRDTLPAVPLPRFTLPDSLAKYGLPSGLSWGIHAPVLKMEAPHFTLRGESGID